MSQTNPNEALVYSVSDFVAYVNQTLNYAYPQVVIEGELANFRVSKNKWVYFDLKDDTALVKFFGTVYQLSGPLEDGLMLRVSGVPQLHPLYGFSVTIQSIRPVGEGSLRRAADLLAAKLQAEGLFDPERKRPLPYPPRRVALITAGQSAAYADFVKIARARWGGLNFDLYDVLVQGERSAEQLVRAISLANEQAEMPDVVVMIRGGGSAEDLAAFSDERVVRAVAASRVPTLVAIGHEVDISLAELAADVRASTPSNAAELLFPDKRDEFRRFDDWRRELDTRLSNFIVQKQQHLRELSRQFDHNLWQALEQAKGRLTLQTDLLAALNPRRPLEQGYALIRQNAKLIRRAAELQAGSRAEVEFIDGSATAEISQIKLKKGK